MLLYFLPLAAAAMGWLLHRFAAWYLLAGLRPARLKALTGPLVSGLEAYVRDNAVLSAAMTDPALLEGIRPYIENHLDHFLNHKLGEKMPAIAMFMGEKTLLSIKAHLMEELDQLLPGVLATYARNLEQNLPLAPIVDKALEGNSLRESLMRYARPWAHKWALLGAISGFLIGCLMLAFLYLCR